MKLLRLVRMRLRPYLKRQWMNPSYYFLSLRKKRTRISGAITMILEARPAEGWFGQPKYSTFSKLILRRIGLASSIIFYSLTDQITSLIRSIPAGLSSTVACLSQLYAITMYPITQGSVFKRTYQEASFQGSTAFVTAFLGAAFFFLSGILPRRCTA